MTEPSSLIPVDRIETSIVVIRGHKVMLDSALAKLYGVTTKRLNEQVRRNLARFPDDFMFRLSAQEWGALRSQNATANSGRGGRRSLPFAFTEHGALMVANVLNSPAAVHASIQVVRVFVRLRQAALTHEGLARKIASLERRYDAQFKVVFEAIRELMTPPEPKKKRRIGF